MANGEILTCGICSNPLREGELNQLRISPDEIKKFRDYQTKKTLDIYFNQTRGVIKCPNQNCSWIAEGLAVNWSKEKCRKDDGEKCRKKKSRK